MRGCRAGVVPDGSLARGMAGPSLARAAAGRAAPALTARGPAAQRVERGPQAGWGARPRALARRAAAGRAESVVLAARQGVLWRAVGAPQLATAGSPPAGAVAHPAARPVVVLGESRVRPAPLVRRGWCAQPVAAVKEVGLAPVRRRGCRGGARPARLAAVAARRPVVLAAGAGEAPAPPYGPRMAAGPQLWRCPVSLWSARGSTAPASRCRPG